MSLLSTCALKVDTGSSGWHKTMMKVSIKIEVTIYFLLHVLLRDPSLSLPVLQEYGY